MKFKSFPRGKNIYCGPVAIAAFAGCDPKIKVAAIINKIIGKKYNFPVKYIKISLVRKALAFLQVPCSKALIIHPLARQSLLRFVENNSGKHFIVQIDDHFVAVSDGFCLDNNKMVPESVYDFSMNDRTVDGYIQIY